ncbi:THO complex subunit 4C [Trichoplusia ni]|uniref:THO complex subunit 4C n=1 Tax=Trichoplusia ni TaxID=7111 RepID=A0A7E5VD91_TRINI|nr:THO complex subunit 4C [Trichoplusia ni]
MADSVNMSLDEIIKQNKQNRISRSRGRGGGNVRGRGGGRGRGGRGRGRGNVGRSRSQSRPGTPAMGRGRSRSRGPGNRSQSRSQSRNRSRSRQRRSNSRARSASRSRSQLRGLTPKGRAGLEEQTTMPHLVRGGRINRGGMRGRLMRSNSNQNLQGTVHSRLGVTTRRGMNNIRRPLAVAKRGISKRGRGLVTSNRYSAVGLRSDQILMERRQNMNLRNNIIKSQTFTRSRNNSFSSASQLTVSVANDFARRRRNSVGNAGYLNKQSLAQLNNHFGGGYNTRRGPGSVKSMGSNRSNKSNQSNASRKSNRARGRGRGGNRGVGRNFVNKQVLNAKLQKEIAVIQGKTFNNNSTSTEAPTGINFSPTPAATGQSLHQRFATS